MMLRRDCKLWSVRLKRPSVIFVVGAIGMLTYGQQKTLTVGDVPSTVSGKVFMSTPVVQLKKGEVRRANFIIGNGTQSVWDVRVHEFVMREHTIKYPVIGIVSCASSAADGGCSVIASTTVVTADLSAGEEVHSDGYMVQATRAVKAGEKVPTMLFIWKNGQSMTSIEASSEGKSKDDAAKQRPWLTIFDERLQPGDRTHIVDAWRSSKEAVVGLLAMKGMWTSDK